MTLHLICTWKILMSIILFWILIRVYYFSLCWSFTLSTCTHYQHWFTWSITTTYTRWYLSFCVHNDRTILVWIFIDTIQTWVWQDKWHCLLRWSLLVNCAMFEVIYRPGRVTDSLFVLLLSMQRFCKYTLQLYPIDFELYW